MARKKNKQKPAVGDIMAHLPKDYVKKTITVDVDLARWESTCEYLDALGIKKVDFFDACLKAFNEQYESTL